MHQQSPVLNGVGSPGRRSHLSRQPETPVQSSAPGDQVNSGGDVGTASTKPGATFTSCLSIPVQGAIPIVNPDDDQNNKYFTASAAFQQPPDSDVDNLAPGRRPTRKSKTEALLALQTRSVSPPPVPKQETYAYKGPSHAEEFSYSGSVAPLPASKVLDMSLVKTTSQRDAPPLSGIRPFGLDDCPVYRPTPEQFKDPMAYIRSISAEAKNYGICKIVPPEDWKMPFVTDTGSFRFKTRLQRLNSMEATARAKLNFLEKLRLFHLQQGNPRMSPPMINGKPLDLWLLRKEVHKLGGYNEVNRNRLWADIVRVLGYTGLPGLSAQVKLTYARIILPFENFSEQVRNSPALNKAPATPNLTGTNGVSASPLRATVLAATLERANKSADEVDTDMDQKPDYPSLLGLSPLTEAPDSPVPGLRRSTRGSGSPSQEKHSDLLPAAPIGGSGPDRFPTICTICQKKGDLTVCHGCKSGFHSDCVDLPVSRKTKKPWFCPKCVFGRSGETDSEDEHNQGCEVCHQKNRGTEMLLCDGCDCGFHMFCLDPPLSVIPSGSWYCHTCLFETGGDFGFDEGEEHSLSSFQVRDAAFRRLWFERHPPKRDDVDMEDKVPTNVLGSTSISEFDVENEFWRLVGSPLETVEIEYGADVHSTTHGSAMPTLETSPTNPYAMDPWNLNNLPILSESLLRYIKSDISGMTVPWTYVGMVFSTFCWHNEDHYTYSINYMHWGETKTWYGIPGEDADKFEHAIRRVAPDLFETQPDLLFQLVTLMTPEKVKEANVRISACNQRAGEFVITFPKAYHAGFNHGLNFNEAVNFALPDWIPHDQDCVKRYQEHQKQPVFSHDELIISIVEQNHTIQAAMWLAPELSEMVDRELEQRRSVRESGVTDKLEEQDVMEERYQCSHCKSLSYLSQVICPCTSQVACPMHADQLCECAASERVLRLRFSDEFLQQTKARICGRAHAPAAWLSKFHKLLAETSHPQLKTLRALLAEGSKLDYDCQELRFLKQCIAKADEWLEASNIFLSRKPRKRVKRPKGRYSNALDGPSTEVAEEPTERPERGLLEVHELLQQVREYGFDAPEISNLAIIAQQAEEFKSRANVALQKIRNKEKVDLNDYDTLLLNGLSVNVYIEEVVELEKAIQRVKLMQELESVQDDDGMTLATVRLLLSRAIACDLTPEECPAVKMLQDRQKAGLDWDEKAAALLAQPIKSLEELDAFADLDPSIPIDPTVRSRLMSVRSKAKEIEKQARAWVDQDQKDMTFKLSDVLRTISRAEKDFKIPAIQDAKRTIMVAEDLEMRCDAVLRRRHEHREDGTVFDSVKKWIDYAREHLPNFALPNFDKLAKQLEEHETWIRRLPWYCKQHGASHGNPIVQDVLEVTRPDEDNAPSDPFLTCICAKPVKPPSNGDASDAVQCDHCFAKFHGACAPTGGSCPFCDQQHWDGTFNKDRNFHFCYLPTLLLNAPDLSKSYSEAWKDLDSIVTRVDRISGKIGQFLSFLAQQPNQRIEYQPQIRHYMRKLFRLRFAISPSPDVSYGRDLASHHRNIATQPQPPRSKKRRRPKFVFGQDTDPDWADGTRCICRGRTNYLLHYLTVRCEFCERKYHGGCVFFVCDANPKAVNTFHCPLCLLRKNKPYPAAEVRVKWCEDTEDDLYVDVKACLENFSKELVRVKLPPPYTQTLFVDLVRFIPGLPEHGSGVGELPISTRLLSQSEIVGPVTAQDLAVPHVPKARQPINPLLLEPSLSSSSSSGLKRKSPEDESTFSTSASPSRRSAGTRQTSPIIIPSRTPSVSSPVAGPGPANASTILQLAPSPSRSPDRRISVTSLTEP